MKHLLLVLAAILTISGFSRELPVFFKFLCLKDTMNTLTSIDSINFESDHYSFITVSENKEDTHWPINSNSFVNIELFTKNNAEILRVDKIENNPYLSYIIFTRIPTGIKKFPYMNEIFYISKGGNVICILNSEDKIESKYCLIYSKNLSYSW